MRILIAAALLWFVATAHDEQSLVDAADTASQDFTPSQEIVSGIRTALIGSQCPGGSVLAIESPFAGTMNSGFRFTGDFDDDRDGKLHRAVDIATKLGTPVRAVAGGNATVPRFDPNGYGNYVIIDHGNGIKTLYAHLNKRPEFSGPVSPGQVIGEVGNTGWSTGPHLHFELMCGDVRIDPDPHRMLPYQ